MKNILILLIFIPFPLFADELPVLHFSPEFTELERDSIATVEVRVDSIVAFKGFSVQFSYNPGIVEISSVREGSIFSSPSFFATFIDSIEGSVKIESTMLGAGRQFDGSGILFFIDIKGKTAGMDTLSFFDLNLRDVDLGRINAEAKDGILAIGEPSSVQHNKKIPQAVHLYQNYPNPFNPTTTVQFYIPQTSNVTLRVFDAQGREIEVPVTSKLFYAGNNSIQLSGRGYASGVYWYRIEVQPVDGGQSFIDTRRMILLR